MLNRHFVRKVLVFAVLFSTFAVGISVLHQTQAQAREQQARESARAAMEQHRARIEQARLDRELTCLARNIYFKVPVNRLKVKLPWLRSP